MVLVLVETVITILAPTLLAQERSARFFGRWKMDTSASIFQFDAQNASARGPIPSSYVEDLDGSLAHGLGEIGTLQIGITETLAADGFVQRSLFTLTIGDSRNDLIIRGSRVLSVRSYWDHGSIISLLRLVNTGFSYTEVRSLSSDG